MPWPKGRKQSREHVEKARATFIARGSKRKRPQIVDGIAHWQCGTCREWRPESAFYACKRSANGLKSQCRSCHLECAIRTRDDDLAREHGRRSEAKRRARRLGAEVHHLTVDDWRLLATILGDRCLSCGAGEPADEWDHVIPLSEGGPHHPTNLQPLCAPCNAVKHRRDWDYRTPEQLAELAAAFPIGFERVEA